MIDFSDLIADHAVYAVDPPCDCLEIFGVECGRSDEVWSAVPIEECQGMIEKAITILSREEG